MGDKQPNKPKGEHENDEQVTDVENRGAVERQSNVTPEEYPSHDGGRPDYGSPKRSKK